MRKQIIIAMMASAFVVGCNQHKEAPPVPSTENQPSSEADQHHMTGQQMGGQQNPMPAGGMNYMMPTQPAPQAAGQPMPAGQPAAAAPPAPGAMPAAPAANAMTPPGAPAPAMGGAQPAAMPVAPAPAAATPAVPATPAATPAGAPASPAAMMNKRMPRDLSQNTGSPSSAANSVPAVAG
jgi:hypothetical protein